MAAQPLSPFLNYKFGHTMLLSFAHRVSGVFLVLGFAALVAWLMALAGGEQSYADLTRIYGSLVGRVLLLLWLAAFCYHFANGIRHLAWDAGWGLEKRQARRSALLVALIALLAFAALAWLLFCSQAVRS
jgi:succinate dehydrogenase / fumarate reductase cytochrome b subunit